MSDRAVKKLEQNSEILGLLEVTLKKNKAWFLKTIQTIRDENVSNYPILIAYPSFTDLDVGLPIKEEEQLSFNATTLEELAMKKIVNLEKVDEFRKLYKEKQDSFCIFLLQKPAPQFVFVPYA
jgi:hypothetical protein